MSKKKNAMQVKIFLLMKKIQALAKFKRIKLIKKINFIKQKMQY